MFKFWANDPWQINLPKPRSNIITKKQKKSDVPLKKKNTKKNIKNKIQNIWKKQFDTTKKWPDKD